MRVVALALLLCAAGEQTNPVGRVVELIQALKAKITSDGKAEQAVYDEYACWCEKTTGRKTAAIADSKALIAELSTSITELKGRLGSAGADIANYKKGVAENKASQNSAESLRKQENTDYLQTKSALEQGIANLDKAIRVLGDATSSQQRSHMTSSEKPDLGLLKSGDAQRETQLLTVAAGVRSALALYSRHNAQDMEMRKGDFDQMKNFLSSPAAWVQTGSPHKAEYTSQSQGIQGMLKDMHDSFQRDLQDAVDTEATKKEEFDSLMVTKRTDLNLLESSLTKESVVQGTAMKQVADDKANRAETQKQLDTAEDFLATTTSACKAKAGEWAERSRLRAEELGGINQAVDILTSDEAKATLNTADTSLLQVRSVRSPQNPAYAILKDAAARAGSPRLAVLAVKVSTAAGGHFDGVIADVEKMIVKLRAEAKDDVEHRDWCQSERSSANGQNEALEYDITELDNKISRAGASSDNLLAEKTTTKNDMDTLTGEMDQAKTMRTNEIQAFQTAVKADSDSVMLITEAIGSLSRFFEKNALLSKHFTMKKAKQPEYSKDEDTAPETFSGGYGGRGSENTGIVAILGMIKEDMEKEIKVAREEDASSDASYRKLLQESRDSMSAMEKKVNDLDAGVADLAKEVSDLTAVKGDKRGSKGATDASLAAMKKNCDWIEDKFTTRQTQRTDEIAGLEQAKSSLAGMKTAGFVAQHNVVAKRATVDDELKQLDNAEKSFGFSFLQRSA